MPTSRIMVFAKAPIPGQCKTRLAATIGDHAAATLHGKLLRHILHTATHAELCPVELWCADDPDDVFFKQCQHDFDVTLKQQQGTNLGERMAHAFNSTLDEVDHAICIGCDAPALTASDLTLALEKLSKDYDCALKPAEDGGYVLIGLNTADMSIFSNIHWGGASVLQETRKRLIAAGLRYHELSPCWDVDRPEDLIRLQSLKLFV